MHRELLGADPMSVDPLKHHLRQYFARFDKILEPGERPINAGPAVWAEIANIAGRGFGEGVICITNRRLLYRLHQPIANLPSGLQIPFDDLQSLCVRRIAAPMMRRLVLVRRNDPDDLSFWMGKRFAKEVVRDCELHK